MGVQEHHRNIISRKMGVQNIIQNIQNILQNIILQDIAEHIQTYSDIFSNQDILGFLGLSGFVRLQSSRIVSHWTDTRRNDGDLQEMPEGSVGCIPHDL